MLSADDIMLATKIKEEISNKLDEWREVLEGKGLHISHTKNKYLRCDFSGTSLTGEPEVSIGEDVVTSTTKYKYLGSIIQRMGRLTDMSIIEYMRVGSGGEKPPRCYVIESSQVKRKILPDDNQTCFVVWDSTLARKEDF